MTAYLKQRFGDYRLTRLLGSGGFADVYEAEHLYLRGNLHIVSIMDLYIRLPGRLMESLLRQQAIRCISGKRREGDGHELVVYCCFPKKNVP